MEAAVVFLELSLVNARRKGVGAVVDDRLIQLSLLPVRGTLTRCRCCLFPPEVLP
jgi:hypothetical protein